MARTSLIPEAIPFPCRSRRQGCITAFNGNERHIIIDTLSIGMLTKISSRTNDEHLGMYAEPWQLPTLRVAINGIEADGDELEQHRSLLDCKRARGHFIEERCATYLAERVASPCATLEEKESGRHGVMYERYSR